VRGARHMRQWSKSERLQGPRPPRRSKSRGPRSSISDARTPPPTTAPVAPQRLMPSLTTGLVT
jgi:hypothetical protein